MKRRRAGLAWAASAFVLVGCLAATSPGPSAPPAVEKVGLASDVRIGADVVTYVFEDGTILEVDPQSTRTLTDHGFSGRLIVVGSDAEGSFVAAFLTQQGLPPDCYVDNREGIERSGYIEIHGVLWAKADAFVADEVPPVGTAYPAGSRFCFDERGVVTAVLPR